MASSSGSGSGSGARTTGAGGIESSGSEQDLENLMDQRKRKRMISNRESARRSRMRKQKHLGALAAELSQLRQENSEMMWSVSMTTQRYMSVEAENHVLRVQLAELTHHLQSLHNIMAFSMYPPPPAPPDDFIINNSSLSLSYHHPILASADTFMY